MNRLSNGQDPIPSVRKAFMAKLWSSLRGNPNRSPNQHLGLYAMMPLAAMNDDVQLVKTAGAYFNWLVTARRGAITRTRMSAEGVLRMSPESALPFVVHHLAHATNYEEEQDEHSFARYAKCFVMFFDTVLVGSDNLSYMMHVLEKISSSLEVPPMAFLPIVDWISRANNHMTAFLPANVVQDALAEDSDRLYVVAEVAMAVLRARTKNQQFEMQVLEPGGCTASISHFNSMMLNHPARVCRSRRPTSRCRTSSQTGPLRSSTTSQASPPGHPAVGGQVSNHLAPRTPTAKAYETLMPDGPVAPH